MRVSTPSKPGKFERITEFAIPEDQESASITTDDSVDHYPIDSIQIDHPHIIHIEDINTNSRIHNRIMLVTRTNRLSLTCLNFCAHHENVVASKHCQDHAKLTTEAPLPGESGTGPDGYIKLRVSLEFNGFKQQPAKGVYLNLEEVWNVETSGGVKFAILGQATAEEYYAETRQKIIDVYASTLGSDPNEDKRRSMISTVSAPAVLETGIEENREQEEEEEPPERKEAEKRKGKERDKGKGKGESKGKPKKKRDSHYKSSTGKDGSSTSTFWH